MKKVNLLLKELKQLEQNIKEIISENRIKKSRNKSKKLRLRGGVFDEEYELPIYI